MTSSLISCVAAVPSFKNGGKWRSVEFKVKPSYMYLDPFLYHFSLLPYWKVASPFPLPPHSEVFVSNSND